MKRAIVVFLAASAIIGIHLPLLFWPNAFWSIASLIALGILGCAIEGSRTTR